MKKIILLLFIPILLTGCSVKSYTPIIESSFSYDVKYIMGDFCFNCKVEKQQNNIKLTVLDTRAKGLTMFYDGKEIIFSKDDLSYKLNAQKLDKSNPAIIFKDLFDYIEQNMQTCVKKTEIGFVYTGKLPIGNFEAYQNKDNDFYLITIPNVNIRIELNRIDK